MLKTSMLILALTVTLASGALAAAKHPLRADGYNSTYPTHSDDEERLFERAKGSIY